MSRVVLHSDANSFYASVECLYTPSLRGKPMSVCGSADDRHGIVLASSREAKKYGVKTGMAIWQAKQVCPELSVVPPDYELYVHFSRKLRRIYEDYTNRVEPFGLDECWLGLCESGGDIRDGERIADEIRQRVKGELGITVSVGVSFNKVFAKLGSDYKKPDAVTVISQENFKEIAWPLPASDLIYVGPRTTKKLLRLNITTIGQLANADTGILEYHFGKNGIMLKAFALGLDRSAVRPVDESEMIKSVGNSTTPPHDISSVREGKAILYLLVESVAERLRSLGFKAKQVAISARGTDLISHGCQRTLQAATDGTAQIADAAIHLFEERFARDMPFRSMGVSCGRLVPADVPVQLDLFGDAQKRLRAEKLDRTLDSLRYRFGHTVIRRGIVLEDHEYARVNPAGQTIHPVAFLREDGVRYDKPGSAQS